MAEINIVTVDIYDIKPYARNPRNNKKSIDRVAESIRQFGFLQPIVCDEHNVILAGHTRYAAAKKLGLDKVPVIYAENLTEAQAKAYRLADNKAGEGSEWLMDLLAEELETVNVEIPELDLLGFEFEGKEEKRRKKWENRVSRCGLKKDTKVRTRDGYLYTCFHCTGKNGKTLDEIKEDPDMINVFADNLSDYVSRYFGGDLKNGGWCIVTTPKRRHREGVHFATEVCRITADKLGIPFYEDAMTARNRQRIGAQFNMVKSPAEHNVILYDDIMTTGSTMNEARRILTKTGHVVFSIVAIRNQ